jgi:CHAT domain-containing protein
MRDMMNLNLHCDLVVLSACETALGQQVQGEGVLGLTWALFVAGSRSNLVTQWNVNDGSTSLLMQDFYQRLKSDVPHRSKAEALRQAQIALLKNGKYQHPAYWAPYVLFGDWR